MNPTAPNPAKVYFIAMGLFWLTFGLITTFYPPLMNLFQTETGINAVTDYSNHIWRHDGFDIIAISVVLFALSRESSASRNILTASATVALLVTVAVMFSLLTTPYWNLLFLVPGLSCLAFSVWGFMLASRVK